MKNAITVAVSAAIVSLGGYSGASFAEGVGAKSWIASSSQQLKGHQPVSVNKSRAMQVPGQQQQRAKFVKEPNLENREYLYIIHLSEPAVANYDGGIEGLTATNPHIKNRSLSQASLTRAFDLDTPAVKAYTNYLERRQTKVKQQIEQQASSVDIIDAYQLSFNGFVVKAMPDEAERLSRLASVEFVERDRVYQLDTDVSAEFIGATQLWDGSAPDNGMEATGKGIIVGVLDTGVNSDHPSFADIGDDGYDHVNPLGEGVYLGDCAESFPDMCNDKLIGVRSYPSVVDVYDDTSIFPADLPKNGEDYNGHGSHTAGTAAGNILYNVPEVTPEFDTNESDGVSSGFEFDRVSGIAPHANIIAYSVCQPGNTGDTYAGCTGSAMLSAVEDAIADGVDVINFSISGGGFPWQGALNEAWLSARNAGVFIAHSAGNSGPDAETSEKHAPWITSVAASTHGREVAYEKMLTDFSGGDAELEPLTGSSNSGAITASIVYAGDYDNPNDPEGDPAQCLESFPEGTFSGEIVVCDRGAIARVQKAINVADGGAGGYVLANVQGGADNIANDMYVVPGIHIDANQGDALRAWLSSGTEHMATITNAEGEIRIDEDLIDNIAGFSSRGPNTSIDTLNPSIAAPGVSIYAAYSDEQYGQDITGSAPSDFSYLQGTSMASPQVAGAAALLKEAKPEWTPDQIRSALTMTATTNMVKEDGVTPADWFDMGSGRVQVNKAVQAGLVMDETAQNYLAANPNEGGDPKTLNMPSMTDSNCVGRCSWTRTVTATKAGTWSVATASISDGLQLEATPVSFTLEAGESQTITVEADVFNAQRDAWAFGALQLTSSVSPDLHMPVSVIASTGNLPEDISVEAHRNADSVLLKDLEAVEITDFTARSYGLTKATVKSDAIPVDSDNSSILDDLSDGLSITEVNVAEGTLRMVAEIVMSDSPDLDLFVVHDANEDGVPTEDEIVGTSATATALERVEFTNPDAGFYWLIVQNWAASGDDAVDAFELAYGAVTDDVESEQLQFEAPGSVAQLTPFDMRVLWNIDAEEGDRFYGAFDVGTSAEEAGNLGLIGVDVARGQDDVVVTSDLDERAMPGDIVNYSVEVAANFTPEERTYDVSLTLPEGVSLVEGSVTNDGMVDGNTLSWSVTQPSLFGMVPSYSATTNADDEMCRNPDFGQGGGYLDLASLGVPPSTLDGDTVSGAFNAPVSFLGQRYETVTVTDDGFLTLSNSVGSSPWVNQLMPNAGAPNGVVAPLWRDMEFNQDAGAIAYVASAGEAVTIVEWDNMETIYTAGGEPLGDIADFQAVFINQPSASEPNIILSYDNVTHVFGDGIPTTIGYEDMMGESGLVTHHIPYFGADESPVGSVSSDLTSGTQICLWLQDVPDEPTRLSFQVEIDANNSGGAIEMAALSSVDAPGTLQELASQSGGPVQVDGPPVITLFGETGAATVDVKELSELSVDGMVTDPNGDSVSIAWTQTAGSPAVLAGNGLASPMISFPEVDADETAMFEVTATDSTGLSTMATLTVNVNNNDAPVVSVSGPSTVKERDSIDFTVDASDADGDSLDISVDVSNSSAGYVSGMAGNYTFTASEVPQDTSVTLVVTVTDGMATTEDRMTITVENRSGGGSMGWIALLLLPLIYLRRRR